MAITPFRADGSIDEAALRTQLQYMAQRGAGIFLGAINSGEGDLLSAKEARQLYHVGVRELEGAMPVYAAASEPHNVQWIVELARMATAEGCQGTQLYPPRPMSNPPPPDWEREAELFYHHVLEKALVPIFLCNYNHGGPGRVSNELVVKLVKEYPHIVGVNVGSGPQVTRELVENLPRKIPVRGGNLFDNVAAGGDGNLGTEANVIPGMFAQVVDLFKAGRHEESRLMFERTVPFRAFMIKYSNPRDGSPRILKPMLNYLGFKVGEPRRREPLPLEPEAVKEMERMLDELDVKGFERPGA